jgi:hypothetical protein
VTAIVIDDILNGNVSYNGGSFFVGVSSLQTLMTEMKSNINDISSNITFVSTFGL